jgi:hypothetical protein
MERLKRRLTDVGEKGGKIKPRSFSFWRFSYINWEKFIKKTMGSSGAPSRAGFFFPAASDWSICTKSSLCFSRSASASSNVIKPSWKSGEGRIEGNKRRLNGRANRVRAEKDGSGILRKDKAR